MQYQVRNKSNHIIIVDITGKGNTPENAFNLKSIPAGQVLTTEITDKRASELKVQFKTQLDIKPCK